MSLRSRFARRKAYQRRLYFLERWKTSNIYRSVGLPVVVAGLVYFLRSPSDKLH